MVGMTGNRLCVRTPQKTKYATREGAQRSADYVTQAKGFQFYVFRCAGRRGCGWFHVTATPPEQQYGPGVLREERA